MANQMKIAQRDETLVFINKGGGITITQSSYGFEEQVVAIELADIDKVIIWMKQLKEEILANLEAFENDEDNEAEGRHENRARDVGQGSASPSALAIAEKK